MVDLVAVRHAFRRSRLRSEVLVALERLGESSVQDLALALGAEPLNVEGALVGLPGVYRVEECVVGLGLVEAVGSRARPSFRLTLSGRSVAAEWRRARGVYST